MEVVKMYVLLSTMVTLTVSDGEPHIVKSHAITHITRQSNAVHTSRSRRQAQPLTPQQVSEIVDVHNELRAREGASDMELMKWNDFLASVAAGWAEGCKWEHGHPPLGDDPPYTSIGQNLFATTGSTINLTSAIEAWYSEKVYYHYDTNDCDEVCGHYTAVVWAKSRLVGCAYHLCQTMEGLSSAFSNLYLVCNYVPHGNIVGSKPFKKGPACSKCGSGVGWCKDRLCNRDCTTSGDDCSCAAHCYNCATLDLSTCRCSSCPDGWHSADCSVVCNDTHRHCNVSPGWPPHTCSADYVRSYCPAMCKLCTKDPDAKADTCLPVYAPGAYLSAPSVFVKSREMIMIFVTIVISLTIGI